MRTRKISRKTLLFGASVPALLLCVLILLAKRPADGPGREGIPGEVVTMTPPGRSTVWMPHVRTLVEAVEDGKQLSVIRYQSGRREAQQDDQQGNSRTVYPLATTLSGNDEVWINGTFTLVANLHQSAFTAWGPVQDSVGVDSSHGTEPDYLRLSPLIPPYESDTPGTPLPVPPVTLVAIMQPGSKSPVQGHFIGPLTEHDVRTLPDMVKILVREPFGKMTERRAEQLLDSPNPWVAWLGLVQLRDLEAVRNNPGWGPSLLRRREVLRTEHFARAVGSRVPGDADAIVREIIDAANMHETVRGDLHQQVVKLGATAQMQEALLAALLKLIEKRRAGNHGKTHPIDLPALQKAAREYCDKIKDQSARGAVVRQLDAMIALK